ncbi:hypothetical protein E9549_15050 [Blastococcus sp. MG754426]|uniref:hypothetical protein n=1 Tax=unclassified Blastococcus TaxID=2619396 RepID=UPI001EF0C123|nr:MULTISPECIES: hypothetical protein [unclassified Blastococcus]MCF6508712.1 hypothetical protein [Blastococcus sp. MG754426]MCF6513321.1 hypothetical protein [Blastococcus sp. MG754427]MCF6734064.1 hypothetical protein [Blastococcus sp. KM273129]
MGPVVSGKTTLSEYLAHGVVPEELVATGGIQRIEPTADLALAGLKLKVKVVLDASGEPEAIRAWHDQAVVADFLVYLVSYAEAADEAYMARVRRDAGQLRDWKQLGELKDDCHTALVVTHMDCHEPFRQGIGLELAADAERVARTAPAVRAAVRELGPSCTVIAGSLADDEGCADVTARLLTALNAKLA